MAGCVHSWADRSAAGPARPNITSSNEVPRSCRSTASQRSSTARATGSPRYSFSPMPTQWLPCPVNTKATFEGAGGAGPAPDAARAVKPSRKDATSPKTTPARCAR